MRIIILYLSIDNFNHDLVLLRAGHFTEIDGVHIAEELESMGARERREVLSRLQVLIMIWCVNNALLTKR
jgi:hypothetical protein